MIARSLRELQIPRNPTPGVNLVGPFDAGSGLGEAARMLRQVIEHARVPFVAIQSSAAQRGSANRDWPSSQTAPYDVNVLCLQPDQLSEFAAGTGSRFFASRTTVGFWFWESTVFPDRYRPALRLLDRVWVLSEHVRRILAPGTSAPVHVLPLPVAERPVEPITREELGLPRDGFLFLALLDLISARRKNPHAVIQAYRRAFAPLDGARLVLKTINGRERKPHVLAELEAAVADRDDVAVIDGYVSERERDAMLAACDCFVSLHRAEGLGLPMLEAMCLGKPVIATGYSGNLEFMDAAASFLVPFRLVPVPAGEWGHSAAAQWAEPSVEVAASLMRRVFDAPDEAQAVGGAGRAKVLGRFSLDRAAAAVVAELEAARSHPRAAERARRRRSIVEASLVLARDPTSVGYPGRGPVAVLRRVLVRALWPQLAAQQRRDEAMLEGLTEVERAVAWLETRVTAITPNTQAESEGTDATRDPG